MSRLEGRLYGPLVVSLAGTLLAMGVALGVLMVASVIGPFRFLSGEDAPQAPSLALWFPPSSAALPEGERDRQVAAWQRVFDGAVVVPAERDLADLLPEGRGALALPDARSLTDRELSALERYVAAGGGAIVAGSVGVRRADGSWRGYARMRRLLAVARVGPREPTAAAALLVARAGPVTAGLDRGQAIDLQPEDGAPALAAADADLRWAGSEAGASRRRTLGRGRLFWLAAGPEAVAADRAAPPMARLVAAARAWVAREPAVEVLAWPGGAPLAAHLAVGRPSPIVPSVRVSAARDPGENRRAVEAGIARAAAHGELFRLVLPGGLLPPAERDALVHRALRALAARGAHFFARPADVAAWRSLRDGIRTRLDRVGPRRTLLAVENTNREPVARAVLRVYLNGPALAVDVGRTTLQQSVPSVRTNLAEQRVDIVLPELPVGARLAYTLDIEHPEGELEARAGGRTDPLPAARRRS